MTIKRIGVLSTGKVVGLLYALMVFVFGAIFVGFIMLFSVFGGLAAESGEVFAVGLFANFFFALGFMLIGPLFYGIMGGLMGMLAQGR